MSAASVPLAAALARLPVLVLCFGLVLAAAGWAAAVAGSILAALTAVVVRGAHDGMTPRGPERSPPRARDGHPKQVTAWRPANWHGSASIAASLARDSPQVS